MVRDPAPHRIELPGRDERLVVAEDFLKAPPAQDLTVEAWVRIDRPQPWGGVFGALQDNGASNAAGSSASSTTTSPSPSPPASATPARNHLQAASSFEPGQQYAT